MSNDLLMCIYCDVLYVVYGRVHMHMLTCVGVCEDQRMTSSAAPPYLFMCLFIFETRSLTKQNSPVWPDAKGSELWDLLNSTLPPTAEVTGARCCVWIFMWVL